MPRSLRHDVRNGWYHITTRGMGRRTIFVDDHDREHFLDRLGEVVERYGVTMHAYVLMDNHYHLLIETPYGNASRAMQWLNLSYVVWHNRRHQRSGPLFQARYKSIPVDGSGGWALLCSIYLHLNPVRIGALGLGKEQRALEKTGLAGAPDRETVRRRLDVLRHYRWSSYPAYAGYGAAPKWLTRKTLWQRVARTPKEAVTAYREQLEDALKQGVEEGARERLTQALAIGSTAFIGALRRRLGSRSGSGTNARAWRRLLKFGEIARAVETVKGEPWAAFAERRGDWGRDLALHIGRMQGGMTLRELGGETGMQTQAVSKAVTRLGQRLKTDKSLRQTAAKTQQLLEANVG